MVSQKAAAVDESKESLDELNDKVEGYDVGLDDMLNQLAPHI